MQASRQSLEVATRSDGEPGLPPLGNEVVKVLGEERHEWLLRRLVQFGR